MKRPGYLPHFEAVIFDMDGLLFDSEALYAKAWIESARQCGFEISREWYDEELRGTSTEEGEAHLLEKLGPGFPLARFRAGSEAMFTRLVLEEGIPLREGAMKAIELFDRMSIPKAIGTSARRNEMKRNFASYDLAPYFSVIVTADDVERAKPAPDIFLEAARQLGKEPSRVLVLEDSPHGIRAAHLARMIPVLIGFSPPVSAEINGLAKACFPDLDSFSASFGT